jgi:hypothetical protein
LGLDLPAASQPLCEGKKEATKIMTDKNPEKVEQLVPSPSDVWTDTVKMASSEARCVTIGEHWPAWHEVVKSLVVKDKVKSYCGHRVGTGMMRATRVPCWQQWLKYYKASLLTREADLAFVLGSLEFINLCMEELGCGEKMMVAVDESRPRQRTKAKGLPPRIRVNRAKLPFRWDYVKHSNVGGATNAVSAVGYGSRVSLDDESKKSFLEQKLRHVLSATEPGPDIDFGEETLRLLAKDTDDEPVTFATDVHHPGGLFLVHRVTRLCDRNPRVAGFVSVPSRTQNLVSYGTCRANISPP